MRNNHGITLIEAMLAVGLLSIGLLAISATLIEAPGIAKTGKEVSVAINVVRDAMELYKSMNFTALPAVGSYIHTGPPPSWASPLSEIAGGSVTVTVANQVDSNLKKITVEVNWGNGRRRLVTDFLRTEGGVNPN
jgi:type II secretory pathway pseudopilin PulG